MTTKRYFSFWQRTSVRIFSGIVLCAALFLFALPFAAKIYLQKWLVENGADSAIIEKVRINLFTGVAALEGVDIKKSGKTVFSDSTIYLNVGLTNLLGREAFLQQVTLEDIILEVESSEDGSIRIASYTIQSKENGSENTPEKVDVQLNDSPLWILRARTIDLHNITVYYRQPALEVELVIEEALIERINTDPDNKKQGSLTLKGMVNGAPINLDLHRLVVTSGVDVQGNVSLSDFQLDDLADFLGEYLKPFTGVAALNGKVAFSMASNDDLHVAYDGMIHLDKGEIGGDDWGGAKATIDY